ncbi:hypothetical protein BDR07DRAFT_1442310, partial [Suillus spraguei]
RNPLFTRLCDHQPMCQSEILCSANLIWHATFGVAAKTGRRDCTFRLRRILHPPDWSLLRPPSSPAQGTHLFVARFTLLCSLYLHIHLVLLPRLVSLALHHFRAP